MKKGKKASGEPLQKTDRPLTDFVQPELKAKTYQDEEELEYILTKDEEDEILIHTVNSLREHEKWKIRASGIAADGTVWKTFSDTELEVKLKKFNFYKMFNKKDVLKRANANKHHAIWQSKTMEREKERLEKEKAEKLKRCTAEYMLDIMAYTSFKKFKRILIENDRNRIAIKALCYLLSEDDRFETELGFDKTKGLLIRGASDVGKTYLVECVKDNELNPVLIESMLEINEQIKENGSYKFQFEKEKVLYLDDVGTEEEMVNTFGTKVYFFKDFIEKIYLRNKTFNKIILSTNLNFKELSDKYGHRVARRMRGMFNVIDIDLDEKGIGMTAISEKITKEKINAESTISPTGHDNKATS